MKISLHELISYYLEHKVGSDGWVGFTYEEGDSSETCFVDVLTYEEDSDD